MASSSNRSLWWISGIAVVFMVALFMIARGNSARLTREVRAIGETLQGEVAALRGKVESLQTALAKRPASATQVAGLSGCPEVVDPTPKIEALRWEVFGLTQSLEEMKDALKGTPSRKPERQAEATWTTPGAESSQRLALPEPFPNQSPQQMPPLQLWLKETTPEKREIFENVLREVAADGKRRIQAESEDPNRPDPQVMMRVMEETQGQIEAKLQEKMPDEDIKAIFQLPAPEAGLGSKPAE